MQEIASNVFIEHNSIGLVAGIIHNEQGTVLIDSPVRNDDAGSWRGGTARMVTGQPRYMVVLDSNYDRLLSIKGSDCIIVAHTDSIQPIRSRIPMVKSADELSLHDIHDHPTGTSRIQSSEINFDDQLTLYLNGLRIELEHHPGSNQSGVWAVIPDRDVVFVGDAVVVDQPPFLAYSNLEVWEKDLKELGSKRFKDYQVVSARNGLVNKDQIKTMAKNIAYIKATFEKLATSNAPLEEWHAKIPAISNRISELDLFNSEIFYNRLHWGISTYYGINQQKRG